MTDTEAARRRHARGLAMLVVVVLAWGTCWPVNKALLDYMPPLWSLALRSVVSALALFAISIASPAWRCRRRHDAPVLISMVLLHMVGFAVLATLALQFVPGRALDRARLHQRAVGAALRGAVSGRAAYRRGGPSVWGSALLGLIVIFNPLTFDWSDGRAVFGNAALLVGALLWGVSIVHNRAHAWRATPFQLAPWQALLAAVILIGIAAAAEGVPAIDWNVRSVLLLLFAGIPGTALAYWAVAVASSSLPAATTSLGLLGTPAVSVIVSMVMLGEQPTVPLIAPCARCLILAGVIGGHVRLRPARSSTVVSCTHGVLAALRRFGRRQDAHAGLRLAAANRPPPSSALVTRSTKRTYEFVERIVARRRAGRLGLAAQLAVHGEPLPQNFAPFGGQVLGRAAR